MVTRLFYFLALVIAAGGLSVSCSEDIPDCPSKMCVIAGSWYLTEVYVDDVKDNTDISNYRLILEQPSPTTATTSQFERTQPSGSSDDGTWSLENNESIVRLVPGNDVTLTEDWIIESYSPRKLVLVITRDTGIKGGPSKIRFVLEPI